MDDHLLAKRAARGDDGAFAELAKRYLRFIYTVAYQILLHEEDARDVAQEVLSRLPAALQHYRETGTFRAWLAKMTANRAIDCQRQRSRRERATEPGVLIQLADERISPTASHPRTVLEEREQRQRMDEAMQRLSRQQRAILLLQLKEDLAAPEIAEALGIPVEQVRVQRHRAIQKIRDAMRENNSTKQDVSL